MTVLEHAAKFDKQGITTVAKSRHTAKGNDPKRIIPDEKVEQVKELLRFSPSSTNVQPWSFILAATKEGKERIAKATGRFPFNRAGIVNASHVVVFASRLTIDDNYLGTILNQEETDGRFGGIEERKEQMHSGRSMFVDLHAEDIDKWNARQTYLNMGQFLLGVAALGLDATPMEGVELEVLDEEFGLRENGFQSLAVVTLGYSDPETDYNAELPKSRLPYSEMNSP